MSLPKTGIEPLDRYAEGVASGDIPVCKWVRLAVERHYRDLERSQDPDYPYYFEPKACLHYVHFFRDHLKHYDGIFAGQPIEFEDWQYFVWGSPFGWLRKEPVRGMKFRRFREIIVIIPKKQGKSIIIGGTMLYMLDYDGWPGAQIYALAENRSHAEKLGYRDATKMVKNSEELSKRFNINRGAATIGIYCPDNDSYIQPLTSKPKSTDGFKVHMAGNDEIKDWTDFEIYDIMKDGTASNPNALIANITTAGDDRSSLGFQRQQHLKKVLEGTRKDERTFGVIFTISEEDREKFNNALAAEDPYPLVEPIIRKANPNYGVSVDAEYYRTRVMDAVNSQREKNKFLTKHLNVWINAMDHYYSVGIWLRECHAPKAVIPEEFEGRPCYLHLDLASRKDICSMYGLFRKGTTRDGKSRYATFGINFLPEAVVSENLVGRRAEYNAWAESGHFHLTPGNTTDEEAIEQELAAWAKRYRVMRVGFDEWNAWHLAEAAKRMRLKPVLIKQNTKNLSEPMKELEAWITYRRPSDDGKGIPDPRILHSGDPVLSWALGNIVAKEDANENVFPRKEHEDAKIDPGVTLINLVALEMETPLPSGGFRRRVPKVYKV